MRILVPAFAAAALLSAPVAARDLGTPKDLPWGLGGSRAAARSVTGCQWAGPGYVKMAGTDTCVRLSGSVRAEVGTSSTPAPFVPGAR